ncbi:MAG TPA: glycoside hydrolase family 3 C-terminal domain-containing protein [Egibacteraceae bacterium]|nr:glycoside hydrolase family 3 C-terminal domain-containing protein [Egibacteraceae bacterium]
MSDVGERELRERASRLSLDQKVRLLTGADVWSLHPEPSIGLRRLVMSDGPAGVRGERWDERDPSANVPSPTALAAMWDTARVERLGTLLAAEARRKGVDVVLAPTVNLHRTPYGGRHFECFSEDPLLTAHIGAAFVRGLQRSGVGATVKHFVANDSETQRRTLDAQVDERTLRELYLAPFEHIVREAGAWAVMASYNAVDGVTMTESPLLRDVLHNQWGFDGVVVSDWHATRSTAPTARAGLDLAMPGPDSPWSDGRLLAAVRDGQVSEAAIDDKVLRVLRLAARVGALEDIAPDGGSPPPWAPAETAEELRSAASAGFVLLRNEAAVLPIERSALRRIAVVGPNAAVVRTLGGGSATVFPPYTVSPLEGIREAVGDGAEVVHTPGVRAHTRTPVAKAPWVLLPGGDEPGVDVQFLTRDGAVIATEQRTQGAFVWMGSVADGVPIDQVAAVRVRTVVDARQPGRYHLGSSGLGRFRLSVRGSPVAEAALALPEGTDDAEAIMRPPQLRHPVDAVAGERFEVVLDYEVPPSDIGILFQLNLEPPMAGEETELERAEQLARDADVAVVVVGTTEEVESEGFDRDTLALPGRQDELVRRVAAANPRTVVIVNAGAPVLLPWADEVAAVLLAWFPGQEAGNALADVLFGEVEPGGRLPVSWPASERGLPSTTPVDGVLSYDEGLHVGYRGAGSGGPSVQFPFGHGLGYTTWRYEDVGVEPTDDGGCVVRVDLRNAGDRPGREVVQVYAARADSGVDRPPRWLVGFAGAQAEPGASTQIDIRIPARAFQHWDVGAGAWTTEPGDFQLEVGPAAGRALLTAAVTPAGQGS